MSDDDIGVLFERFAELRSIGKIMDGHFAQFSIEGEMKALPFHSRLKVFLALIRDEKRMYDKRQS